MATKPSSLPLWSTTGPITEPTTPEKQAGWTPGQKPPAQWLNWWQNLVYLWAVWLDAFETEAHTWSATQTFDGSVVFNNGLTVDGNVSFNPSLGTPTFHAGATFVDVLGFNDFMGADGYAINSLGLLRLGSQGGTGAFGGASGEIRLTAGAAKRGAVVFDARSFWLNGEATKAQPISFYLGEVVGGLERVQLLVIQETFWIVTNAIYDAGSEIFERIDDTKACHAICIGPDTDWGMVYPIKFLVRMPDESSTWAPSLWRTTEQGVGTSAGRGSIAVELRQTPTLLNNYINDNFTPSVGPVQYWKDPFGVVHFEGSIRLGTGSNNNVAFTLPQAYRPQYRRYLPTNQLTSVGVRVESNGDVIFTGTDGSVCPLDGLTFSQ